MQRWIIATLIAALMLNLLPGCRNQAQPTEPTTGSGLIQTTQPPESTDPTLPSSQPTQPATTAPEEPSTVQTEPASTVPTEPATTAPEATEPGTTQPKPTEPKPAPTQPKPTEQKPTTPLAPTQPTVPPESEPLPPSEDTSEVVLFDFSLLVKTPYFSKLPVGGTLQLDYEFETKRDNFALAFASSDTSIAHVGENGLVTGFAEGAVFIEVYILVDGQPVRWDWIELWVVSPDTKLEKDPLDFAFLVSNASPLAVGASKQMAYDFTGSADLLRFVSSDPSIATVDNNGIVTGGSEGLVYIEAQVWNGTEYTFRDFLAVQVIQNQSQPEAKPDDDVIPGGKFKLSVSEIRLGDIELVWPAYVTNQKNTDGTPATVYYNIYCANRPEGPFYLDCGNWEETSLYMGGFNLGKFYFKVRAYVVCNSEATAVAESNVAEYFAKVNENVVTSSRDWNFDGEQMAQARQVAKAIADRIMADASLTTDLERIAVAAKEVIAYAAAGDYVTSGPYYNSPYGVFIAGQQSCAGCTRALGLILEYMGFTWGHVNPNAWDHQWCVVYDVDGKTAYADGSWIGVAGYGSWLLDKAYEYVEGTGLVEYTGSRPFYYLP